MGKVSFVAKNESARNKRDDYDRLSENQESESKTNTNESTSGCDESSQNENQSNKSHKVMSSVLATMWMGTESGMIYVHSSVANWSQCLHSVKMEDCVVSIM